MADGCHLEKSVNRYISTVVVFFFTQHFLAENHIIKTTVYQLDYFKVFSVFHICPSASHLLLKFEYLVIQDDG